jgi:threonyl-tRNA synthetase
MIHRAPFGSLERFVAVLIEHCAGNFPLWLSPDQVTVLPISERFNAYAQVVLNTLKDLDIRGFVDDRDEKIGRKIRDAEIRKIPYMLIVGERESVENSVSVRRHGQGDKGSLSLTDFVNQFRLEAASPL